MVYSLIGHCTGANTTAPMNTTGANLIVMGLAAVGAPPTDSKSNTWTGLTQFNAGGNILQIWYCFNPTTDPAHTFSGGASYARPTVAAFSGAAAAPFDQQNGTTAVASTSAAAGSVTPTTPNQLLVAAIDFNNVNAQPPVTITGGFTITDGGPNTSSVYGGGLAYLIQTTAAAANPAWGWTNTDTVCVAIATFKAAAGAAAGAPGLPLRGVGD
jgi:hypothetical protein